MIVRVRGKSDKLTKKEVKYATAWMAARLMSSRLVRSLEVTVLFDDKLKEDLGYTEWQGETNYRPKEFIVAIKPEGTRKKQLTVLAHELTHVKQYARGEMVDSARESATTRWYRKPVDFDRVPYYDLPWEIEAIGREVGLYTYYVEHLNKNAIRF